MPSEHTQDHSALQAGQRDLEAKIYAAVIGRVEELIDYTCGNSKRRAEAKSPIEEMVLLGLDVCASLFNGRVVVEAQVTCGKYTLDLVAHYADVDSNHRRVVIECDGHEFHHSTREQVARDKARDRFVSGEYGRVLRFSGTEIYRDLGSVLDEILSAVDDVYWRDRPL